MERIACGDGSWCNKCETNDAETGKAYTLNELGRCDFYRGPGMEMFRPGIDSPKPVLNS